MDFDQSEQFNVESALAAAQALDTTLAARKHVKRVQGELFVSPGTLGSAVGLPRIIALLKHRSLTKREDGLSAFTALWQTLSTNTKNKVLNQLGWYDPHELAWDDPRSNRFPKTFDTQQRS